MRDRHKMEITPGFFYGLPGNNNVIVNSRLRKWGDDFVWQCVSPSVLVPLS